MRVSDESGAEVEARAFVADLHATVGFGREQVDSELGVRRVVRANDQRSPVGPTVARCEDDVEREPFVWAERDGLIEALVPWDGERPRGAVQRDLADAERAAADVRDRYEHGRHVARGHTPEGDGIRVDEHAAASPPDEQLDDDVAAVGDESNRARGRARRPW